MSASRVRVWCCALSLAFVNLLIAWNLFGVEHTAYKASMEGTFIAIARIMVKFPGQWSWWPFWTGGLPFEDAYLPFLHWLVAGFSVLSGLSAGRSFHIVTAAIYAFSAIAMFWMALELSGRLIVSWLAALAYSCISVSSLLVPAIAGDAGGALHLRRLQVLVYYGEATHTAALAMIPVAIVCWSRALTLSGMKWKTLAALSTAAVVLTNAFGIVMLPLALLCWLLANPGPVWWRRPLTAAIIGIVTYAWISPWLSPTFLHAIRASSMTAGGDYRYQASSWVALALAVAGFLCHWLAMRRANAAPHLQFFALFAYVPTALVAANYAFGIALLPQPHRYHLEMDLALALAIVFAIATALDRAPVSVRKGLVVLLAATFAAQAVYSVIYARSLIRGVDPTQTNEYRIAHWLDANRRGERAMISGASGFFYNDFTDNPQLMGGHDQHTVNAFLRIVQFTIYSGTNAGDRDASYSIFWLKAFGAHQISVPGPDSEDYFKPFAHPNKFDGVLPLLWRDRGDSIYEVPMRTVSLAHVIPAAAVVSRVPIHGLDIAPAEPFVAALEDPTLPLATFHWTKMDEAEIHTTLTPGQVVAIQVTYSPGWEAWANGRRQPVHGDAIGQTVIAADCTGPCDIILRYTAIPERPITRALSIAAMLFALVCFRYYKPRQIR